VNELHVGYRGHCGQNLLTSRLPGFDPKKTCLARGCCNALALFVQRGIAVHSTISAFSRKQVFEAHQLVIQLLARPSSVSGEGKADGLGVFVLMISAIAWTAGPASLMAYRL